jgi:hypothetical protein
MVNQATIPLRFPLSTHDGVKRSVTMRRPDITDYAEVGQFGGDDLARGFALVARLCGLSIFEIQSLSVPDFKAVMAEFNRLTHGVHA